MEKEISNSLSRIKSVVGNLNFDSNPIFSIILSIIEGKNEKATKSIKLYEKTSSFVHGILFKSLPKTVENFINGKSYKINFPIKITELSYLVTLHYGFDNKIHVGVRIFFLINKKEMVVHNKVGDEVLKIFDELFSAKFPIEKMILIDEYNCDDDLSMSNNNSSSLCCRNVTGKTNVYSKHSFGLAIDINPKINPYIKKLKTETLVLPKNGIKFVERNPNIKGIIIQNDVCVKSFEKFGWKWGGNWESPIDYQHFEKNL